MDFITISDSPGDPFPVQATPASPVLAVSLTNFPELYREVDDIH